MKFVPKRKKKIDLSSKKIVMIIAPENFRDEEFFEPKIVFEQYGTIPVVASKLVSTAHGKMGSKAKVDIDYHDIDINDFHAIILVGGGGAKIYIEDEAIHKLIQQANEDKKVIGAICIAPMILASAGIMNKVRFTSDKAARSAVKKSGGKYVPRKRVVVHKNIITGNGPLAAEEFGEKISRLLLKKKK